jgi:hypothetical protein
MPKVVLGATYLVGGIFLAPKVECCTNMGLSILLEVFGGK